MRRCGPKIGGLLSFALILTFIPAFAVPSDAQTGGTLALPGESSTPRTEEQFVSAVPSPTVNVAAGSSTTVQLRFRVVPGDHINSSQPKSVLLIPTKLALNPPTDIAVGKVSYPVGQDLSFAFAPDEKLNVYTGEFAVSALLRPARSASTGTVRVHGELRYQACNDRACFPPKKLPVDFDVNVTRAHSLGTRRNPGQSPHIHQ
jgi:hypothetical protein